MRTRNKKILGPSILKTKAYPKKGRNRYGTGVQMTTKTCIKCGLTKDENEFGWERPGHRNAACKRCRADHQAEYYERNKEKELKYKWERQVRQREKARLYVFTYLSKHPCVDCGESDPIILTFDHVRGIKKMAVSQMVNQG